jgi:hypothetical protein
MKITYESNNSGGVWWLKDEDWNALHDAGWEVEWEKRRWLGAVAKTASKEFASIDDAIKEFESITGQDANSKGCDCCGRPHEFYED